MTAVKLLGQIAIPAGIAEEAALAQASWPRSRRDVWEIPQKRSYDFRDTEFLSATMCQFAVDALGQFAINKFDEGGHALVLFNDVELHKDEDYKCCGTAAAFFQVVLGGTGFLHFPGVADKSLRKIRLEPGLAYYFNPTVRHRVTGTSGHGVAVLSALIQLKTAP